jgi:hypothetical protein
VADGERPAVRSLFESWWQSRRMHREREREVWAAFPNLDGLHLELRVVEGEWRLGTREGTPLAVINEAARFPSMMTLRRIRQVRIIEGPRYLRQRLGDRFAKDAHFVEANSGVPILRIRGRHSNREAGTMFDQMGTGWGTQFSDGGLWFPVQGKKKWKVRLCMRSTRRELRVFSFEPRLPGWYAQVWLCRRGST